MWTYRSKDLRSYNVNYHRYVVVLAAEKRLTLCKKNFFFFFLSKKFNFKLYIYSVHCRLCPFFFSLTLYIYTFSRQKYVKGNRKKKKNSKDPQVYTHIYIYICSLSRQSRVLYNNKPDRAGCATTKKDQFGIFQKKKCEDRLVRLNDVVVVVCSAARYLKEGGGGVCTTIHTRRNRTRTRATTKKQKGFSSSIRNYRFYICYYKPNCVFSSILIFFSPQRPTSSTTTTTAGLRKNLCLQPCICICVLICI